MKCPHCNQEHPDGTKFCPETGLKMPSIVGCKNKECPNYGMKDIPAHYKFCPECGTPLVFFGETVVSQSDKGQQTEMTKCRYEGIGSFHEGLACVCKNGKYGYVDKNGAEIIECKYDFAGNFSEGLALVNDGKYKFIDKKGDVAFLLDDSLEFYGINNGFSEGLCKVGNKIENDIDDEDDSAKIGFIDRTGRLVIDCQFNHASDFHNGYALVWDDGDEDDYGNCPAVNFRYIDINGHEVIGCFDSATEFRDGYAIVQTETLPKRRGNYKTRVIDVDGRDVYKLDMNDLLRDNIFSESFSNYGLHDNVFRYSYREWIDLKTGKKHAYHHNDFNLSKDGFFDGFAAIKDRQDKWGFINIGGDIVIECQFYNNYDPMFSEGLACVKQDNLWGYIDRNGKLVIPFLFTEASSFSEGRAVVKKGNNLMVIDDKGNRIV